MEIEKQKGNYQNNNSKKNEVKNLNIIPNFENDNNSNMNKKKNDINNQRIRNKIFKRNKS